MSLWDDLKKRALGVVAQVNPFDGGKTYDTVVNNKPVATQAKPIAKPAVVSTAVKKSPAVSVPGVKPTTPSPFKTPGLVPMPASNPTTITAPKPAVMKTPDAKVAPAPAQPVTSNIKPVPAPAKPVYTAVQRPDKGFDLMRDKQKVDLDTYVKESGVDREKLIRGFAEKGDQTSIDSLAKRGVVLPPKATGIDMSTVPTLKNGGGVTPSQNRLQDHIQKANEVRAQQKVDEKAKNRATIDEILTQTDNTSFKYLGNKSLRSYVDQYNQMTPIEQRQEKQRLTDKASLRLTKDNYGEKQNREEARAALAVLGEYGKDGYDMNTFSNDVENFPVNIVKGAIDTYSRITKGNARVLDELTVGSTREAMNSRRETINQLIQTRQKIMDGDSQYRMFGTLSPEAQKNFDFFSRALQQEQDILKDAEEADYDVTDPTKYAGAGASVILDALTAGAAGNVARIAKGVETGAESANIASKILNPQTIKQGVGSGAALGTGYGIASQVEQRGSEVTPEDIVQGAAEGMAGGVVLGGLTGIISRGGVKTWDALNEATPGVLNTIRTSLADEGGSINLGAINDSINGFATRNNPAILSLREHLNLLRQADEQMAANGLAEGYSGRVNNRKAQELVLNEINSLTRSIAQGGYLRIPGGRIGDLDLNAMSPAQRKLIEDELEAAAFTNNPKLMQDLTGEGERILSESGSTDIPRMHVEDLKQYLGNQIENVPTRYRRTTGERDIDLLAQRAGFDDVESFIDAALQQVAGRNAGREAREEMARLKADVKEVQAAFDRLERNASLTDVGDAWSKAKAEQAQKLEKAAGAPEEASKLAQQSHEIMKRTDSTYNQAAARAAKLQEEILVDRANGIDPGIIAQKQEMLDKLQKAMQVKRVARVAKVAREAAIKEAPTPVSEIIGEKRTGEKFAKPRPSFEMTQGDATKETPGVILSESAGGRQRRRLVRNGKTGVAEVLLETRNPDGSWSQSLEREPAIAHKNDFTAVDAIMDKVEDDATLNAAAKEAIDEGKELHFYAAKQTGDPSSRSAEIVPFDSEKMIIDGGFVRDAKTNQILGNHIKVDSSGIQINIGKNVINMESIVGDTAKWKNLNKVTYTMDRMLEAAAPTKEIYRKTRQFVVEHKQKAEANMRRDLAEYRDSIVKWQKDLDKVRPSTTRRKDFLTDVFYYAERKLAQPSDIKDVKLNQEGILKAKYGDKVAGEIQKFDKWARDQYDSLLDRTNEVLREFGHDEVPKRQNYMTHLQEDSFWDQIGIGEDLYRDLSSGIQGEANVTNRGQLPGTVAGRTENFRPTKKYNPFHQTRRGKDSMTDPFKAMDAYGEAALFNIHMTESAVRARSLESVFRTAEEIVNKDMLQEVSKTLRESLVEAHKGQRGDLVVAFQEYANALAGKSNAFDRVLQDKGGKAGRIALALSRKLQRIASNSSIVGNVNTTISQALNLPNIIGTNGGINLVKGYNRMMGEIGKDGRPMPGTPGAESDFLNVRYTDAQSRINRTKLQIVNRGLTKALFMEQFERAMTESAWYSSYEKALKDGFKGSYAIKEADRMTERIVGGRGIGDQPEIYRSTVGRTFLQYTLEVNAALKNVRKDMTPAGVIKYAIAVFGMNWAIEQLTGRAPLPDFIGATVDTAADFLDTDSYKDENVGDKLLQGGQRFLAQGANLSPVTSAAVNTFLSQDARKALFGDDSNFGRYDGSPAAASVVSKLIQGGVDLAAGNFGGAWDKTLSAIPYGGQIRKTGQGLEAMLNGYTKDGKGNPATKIDTSNPLTWVQAVLFGKNATPEVRAYYQNNMSALGEDQSKTFKKLEEEKGKPAAIEYMDAVQERREAAKDNKSTGTEVEDDTDFEAEKKVKIAEGDWEEKDGVVVYADSGDVVTSYYKKKAKKAIEDDDRSDAAYDAILKANGVKTLGSGKTNETGNATLDKLNKLNNIADEKDVIGQAVKLIKNTGDKDGVPDWATKRYLKDNKIDESDAVYATKASFTNDVKGAVVRDDIKGKNHDEVINYLNNGRIESIAGDYWVTQGILAELRDEGVISKAEYKALNSAKYNSDGSPQADADGGSGSKKVSAAELGALTAGNDIASKIAAIIAKASEMQSPGKISYKKRT